MDPKGESDQDQADLDPRGDRGDLDPKGESDQDQADLDPKGGVDPKEAADQGPMGDQAPMEAAQDPTGSPSPMAMIRDPMGDPMGVDQDPMGVTRDPLEKTRDLMGDQGPMGDRDPMEVDRDPMGADQDPMGDRDLLEVDQDPMGDQDHLEADQDPMGDRDPMEVDPCAPYTRTLGSPSCQGFGIQPGLGVTSPSAAVLTQDILTAPGPGPTNRDPAVDRGRNRAVGAVTNRGWGCHPAHGPNKALAAWQPSLSLSPWPHVSQYEDTRVTKFVPVATRVTAPGELVGLVCTHGWRMGGFGDFGMGTTARTGMGTLGWGDGGCWDGDTGDIGMGTTTRTGMGTLGWRLCGHWDGDTHGNGDTGNGMRTLGPEWGQWNWEWDGNGGVGLGHPRGHWGHPGWGWVTLGRWHRNWPRAEGRGGTTGGGGYLWSHRDQYGILRNSMDPVEPI